jgi:NADH dehydrogenase
MARIVVLGAGFAGLWAAIGAARRRDEIGAAGRDIEIRVVDRNPYHNIRVRNYEADLSEVALPLPQLLDPIGVTPGMARSKPSTRHGARFRSSRAAARRR